MSSTGRSLIRKDNKFDFYITNPEMVRHFLNHFFEIVSLNHLETIFLDPCAGGNDKYEPPYPKVLREFEYELIKTLDIREDSLAEIKADYLTYECKNVYDVIITNPPFNIAIEIIKKALFDVRESGFVIMLLRLNILGTVDRFEFWKNNPPRYIFVHHKRASFIPDDIHYINEKEEEKILKAGSTDSIEYAHFVWLKGYLGKPELIVI